MWKLTQSFAYQGHRIAYDTLGQGAPMVLIHGTPFSSYVWRKIAPLLARDRQVLVYDLLGYGQSDMPLGEDVSLGVQNQVLAALLGHVGFAHPDVIAHDFGGATALRGHILNGLDYRRLMLIDPVAIRPWGSPFVQHVRAHEAAFAGQPDYIQHATLKAYIGGAAHRSMAADTLEAYAAPWRGEPGPAAFYQQIAQMDQRYTDEIEARMGEVRCPVRLLWGLQDEWIPVASGRRLSGMLPGCDYSEVDGAGHLMQEDAPEAIVAAALRFFH